MSHHGRAAEKDVVADGGEEFHALLQTILWREDNKTIRLLLGHFFLKLGLLGPDIISFSETQVVSGCSDWRA